MTDREIIALYWQRSEAAIAATEKVYGRYCHCIAYGILRSKEDSCEVVNDTYLKAWHSIPPQQPNPLKIFLGRIARQLAINRLEQNTAQKRGSGQYTLALEELTDCTDGSPLDISEQIALREALEHFLQNLPMQTRQIFLMRYWYFQSIAEISEAFNIGQSKVKMQLLRTREHLKIYLQEEGLLP